MAGIGAGDVFARLRLDFGAGRGPARLSADLQANRILAPGPARSAVRLGDGVHEFAFRVGLKRRGEGRLERAFLRWRGPLGLAWRERAEPLDRAIVVTPDLRAVEREAAKLFSRTMMHGIKPLRDRGDGSEFDALAEFQNGMDRRLVDWKQSARHNKLLAKEVRAERNHQIVFAMDTGRLMCEPVARAPRVDWGVNAALLLADVSLVLGGGVAFFGFDARPHLATGFAAGPGAFAHLQALTGRLDYSSEETNYTLGLTTLAERLQRRSMVVVFTDFADSTSAELMVENITRLARRHMIMFVAFRDEELESLRDAAPQNSDDVSRAVIAQRLLRERSIVLARLRRLGVRIVDAPLDRLGPELVQAYDQLRREERI
jgi:uncharacterized protein (DUF58 family)